MSRSSDAEFRPTHKFAVASNHAPTWDGDDHGIDRRVRVVPFPVKFWNPDEGESGPAELRQDKELKVKLAAERSGILNWMLRGCDDWQRSGMPVSAAMSTAKAEVRHAATGVKRFLEARTARAEGETVQASVLHAAYVKFAGEEGVKPVSSTAFGLEVPKLVYNNDKVNSLITYFDLGIVNVG